MCTTDLTCLTKLVIPQYFNENGTFNAEGRAHYQALFQRFDLPFEGAMPPVAIAHSLRQINRLLAAIFAHKHPSTARSAEAWFLSTAQFRR